MNRSRILRQVMVVVLMLALPVVSSAGAAERVREPFTGRHHPISARSHSGRYSATLRYTGFSPTRGGWGYQITSRRVGMLRSVMFSSVIQQAFELDVSDDVPRATVIGWATDSGVEAFDVVDVATAKLIVEVPCYKATVSPSGRYIAFVQWHPPHLATMVHLTAVYRVAEIARLPRKLPPVMMDDYVGAVVYPKSRLTIGRNSLSTDVAKIHQILGGFDWSDDSHYSFVDSYAHRATTVHVVIGPSGLDSLKVTTR